jgi:TonB family protein
MEAFVLYQIKSACCLGLFCLGYLLLVRNLTFYRLNRFYLLSAMFLSVTIPVLSFRIPVASHAGFFNVVLDTVKINAAPEEMVSTSLPSWTTLILYIYLVVSIALTGFFVHRLMGLTTIIRRHGIKRKGNMLWVNIPDNLTSFSFFNILFVNSSWTTKENENSIVEHEMAHARQFHSLDIVLLECIKIMQWFNPFIYIIQRLLKETHEYLADEAVLEQNSDSAGYRLLLLSQVFGIQPGISNCFNHSLIKKRFAMMTKEKSPFIRQVRYLMVFPMTVLLFLVFSFQEVDYQVNKEPLVAKKSISTGDQKNITEQKEADDDVFLIVEEMPEFQGGSAENCKAYIRQNLVYPENAKKAGIRGKVYVQFIVNENGQVTNTEVIKGVDPELDKEACRVISSMPAWKPGVQRGKPVKVSFTIPIVFDL